MVNIKIDLPLLKKHLKVSMQSSVWDLGNSILYEMCKKYPKHNKAEEIIAKVWLIGRSYSASLERRKNKSDNDGEFYEDRALPIIKSAKLDFHFSNLHRFKITTESNLEAIINAHAYLTRVFNKISDQDKVSLASKYLHFHFPKLFFLSDTRSIAAMRTVISGSRIASLPYDYYGYGRFSLAMICVRNKLKSETGKLLAPRQLDNLFLSIADSDE